MRSGAWELARKLQSESREVPDLLLVSDYLDLPAFLGSMPPEWSRAPVLAYFHENQLTYPPSPTASNSELERDRHFAWTNVMTCVRADHVVFNSEFHREDFRKAASDWLKILPRPNPRTAFLERMQEASVIAPGIDLLEVPLGPGAPEGAPLRVVFNQRFDHDKNPVGFLRAVRAAVSEGVRLELCLLGQRFENLAPEVETLCFELEDLCYHAGFVASRREYARILGASDLVACASHHEFFGIAVAEAMAAGCTPLCPRRLAYPELVPAEQSETYLFEEDSQLATRLARFSENPALLRARETRSALRATVERHDVSEVARRLDERVSWLAERKSRIRD